MKVKKAKRNLQQEEDELRAKTLERSAQSDAFHKTTLAISGESSKLGIT